MSAASSMVSPRATPLRSRLQRAGNHRRAPWWVWLRHSKRSHHLITALLNETDIPRIRIGSLEPWDFPEDFISLFESERLCRHLHLPLQSGSNTVLRRMIRRCTVESYSAIVEQLRAFDRNFTITSDFIVGFPGETEHEFQETITTLEQLTLADLHLFPYSLRAGTAASRLPRQLPKGLKQERLGAWQIGARHRNNTLRIC